ncbi:MAG: adenylate/guanylate cyclase domain-containing protein [Gallionella sp.]|nr:adenylate/guanylate cyclase domain-containing protein [Gallionella sp.]
MVNESDILNARILIVDDLEFNVNVLDRILKNAGYTAVVSTTNPLEVCDLHRENRYDLILLDIEMPGMDGFQVMEGLKEIEPGDYLPVLVITGHPGYKLRALQLGAKDFISTPFDRAEVLARARNLLEVRLLHEESKNHSKALEQSLREVEASSEVILRQNAEIKQLYDQVVAEKKIAERLLLNVLPQSIAERLRDQRLRNRRLKERRVREWSSGIIKRLKERRLKDQRSSIAASFPPIIADYFPDVTVLFADIVEFTKFSAGVHPEKLVALLNEIFTGFDNIADNRGLEKIKTIGDAYMAVAGVPVPVDDHVARAAHMALDMMDALADFNKRNGYTLQMRIGINSGAVVAGVIGRHKFIYDLWGDTVNTASRMESQGMDGRVQITDATRQRLGEEFLSEERGVINVKGIGEMHTWFLTGRCCFQKSS